jgi:hypothetical protein
MSNIGRIASTTMRAIPWIVLEMIGWSVLVGYLILVGYLSYRRYWWVSVPLALVYPLVAAVIVRLFSTGPTHYASAAVLAGGVLALGAYVMFNDLQLAHSGHTEQAIVASTHAEMEGAEDNAPFLVHFYTFTDLHGKPIFGEVRSEKELKIGQRVVLTVDPQKRAQPVLGRGPHLFWDEVMLAALAAIIATGMLSQVPIQRIRRRTA